MDTVYYSRARLDFDLAQMKYKPGSTIKVIDWSYMIPGGVLSWAIEISITVEDVKRPGNFAGLRQVHVFGSEELENWTTEHVKGIVYNLFLRAEEHEVMEWFTYDGKNVRDPHPEESPRRRT